MAKTLSYVNSYIKHISAVFQILLILHEAIVPKVRSEEKLFPSFHFLCASVLNDGTG